MPTLFHMGRFDYTSYPYFTRCWKAYPHYKNRSSRLDSLKVWKKRHLEYNNNVWEWLLTFKKEDWGGVPGHVIPAMEKWLRRTDFSEPPPPSERPVEEQAPPIRKCKTPGCPGHSPTRDYCNRCVAEGRHQHD